MRTLIVVSAILVVASAGYTPYHVPVLDQNGFQVDTADVAHAKAAHFAAHAEVNARLASIAPEPSAPARWTGPIHIPVIGPSGVPVETPEVIARRKADADAHAQVRSRTPTNYRRRRSVYSLPVAAWSSDIIGVNSIPLHTPVVPYSGPIHIPVIGPNGVPLDTPEVAAGKAANAAAHAEVKARNDDYLTIAPVAYESKATAYSGPIHIPVIGPNGVPLDTPEVAAGKAANAAAHAEAKSRIAATPVNYESEVSSYSGPQHMPVIGPNGVPLDTPEVVAARANHAAAFAEAKSRTPATPESTYSEPETYSAPIKPYSGPIHIPVIGPNGVPLDTPEVAAGKAANAAAHAEVKARSGVISPVIPVAYTAGTYSEHVPVIGPNGVPLDTPEVAAGKIANAVAHAEVKARNWDASWPLTASYSVAAPWEYSGYYARQFW